MNDSSKKKVLVVDDEPDIVDLIKMALTLANFEVTTAENGPATLKILEGLKPDLILLDIMMPQMTGFEVCKKIRSQKALRSVPIIMLTAKGQKQDAEQGLKLGADDYIIKPFDPYDLAEQVRSMIEKTQQASQTTLNP